MGIFMGGKGFVILSRVVKKEFPGNVTFEPRFKNVKEATLIFGVKACC